MGINEQAKKVQKDDVGRNDTRIMVQHSCLLEPVPVVSWHRGYRPAVQSLYAAIAKCQCIWMLNLSCQRNDPACDASIRPIDGHVDHKGS
jgi:hypothetical protein